jgi:hypothetical protein
VAGGAEHVDVGAGAEHAIEVGGHDHRANLRVLEAETLDGVGQLDVDREVVRVELELVAGAERMVRVHVHGEPGDARIAGAYIEAPVAVAAGMGLEPDRVERLGGFGHVQVLAAVGAACKK